MTFQTIDHLLDGLSKVVTQYRNKPVFLVYLGVYLDQIQKLEDQTIAVEGAFRLADATGFRLDWIGRKVGQPRIGTTDAVYRTYILGRIASNRSRGRILDVQRVAAVILTHYTYAQYSTTIVITTTDDLTLEQRQAVWEMLQHSAPAGVLVYLIQSPYMPGSWFSFGSVALDDGTNFSSTEADGSPTPGTGALLASVL